MHANKLTHMQQIFTLAKFRTPIFANCTIFIWNVLECQLHSIFTITRKLLTCGYDISTHGMRKINSPTRAWKRCTGPDRTCIWRNQFITSLSRISNYLFFLLHQLIDDYQFHLEMMIYHWNWCKRIQIHRPNHHYLVAICPYDSSSAVKLDTCILCGFEICEMTE